MANNGFNFQAKAGLDVRNFKKGTSQLKGLMSNLKSYFTSFAAGIGMGLGFERLISSLKNTAVELNTAKNTLRNVSDVTKTYKTDVGELTITIDNYGKNLQFVKDLSNKYGQDMVALTDTYGKFLASAKGTTIALEDQEYIFEALTRAAATYHLSADRTKDMMNAVVQMMSKGKVVSEELRRQLGNTLPGALNIMAASLGVSVSELDKMMANGELMSANVLPKFAKMLNLVTANAEFGSLQKSINDFKNEWYDFVEVTNAENIFKGLIEKGTSGLKIFSNNFTSILETIKFTLIGFFVGKPIIKAISNSVGYFKDYKTNVTNEIEVIDKSVNSLRKKMSKPIVGRFYTVSDGANKTSEQIGSMIKYNELLVRNSELKKELGIKDELQTKVALKNIETNIKGLKTQQKALLKTEKNILAGTKGWAKFGKQAEIAGKGILKWAGKGLTTLVKMVGKLNWILLAIEAILTVSGFVYGKWKANREELERIANISKLDERIGERMAPTNETIDKIKQLKDEVINFTKDGNTALAKIKFEELKELVPWLDEISYEELKAKGDGFKEFAAGIEKFNQQLKLINELESLNQELRESETQVGKLTAKAKEYEDGKHGPLDEEKIQPGTEYLAPRIEKVRTKAGQAYDKVKEELALHQNNVDDLQKRIKDLNVTEVPNPFSGKTNTDILDIYKENIKANQELERQYNEGAISNREYNDSLMDLAKADFARAAATGALVIENIQKKLKEGKTLSTIEQWYYDIFLMAAKHASYIAYTGSLDAAEKAAESYKEKQEELASELLNDVRNGEFTPESVDDRNTIFDFDKSGAEIASEEFEIAKERVENTKKAIEDLEKRIDKIDDKGKLKEANDLLQQLNDTLKTLEAEADSWEEIVPITEAQEKLKEYEEEWKKFQEELAFGSWDGLAGLVGAVDGVVSAFDRIEEVSNNINSTGWDKFIATFQLFETTLNGVLDTYSQVITMMQIYNDIKDRANKIDEYSTIVKSKEGAVELFGANAKKKGADAAIKSAGATNIEAAASEKNAKSKFKEALGETVKSNSKLGPFGWLGIAAAVAAIVSAFGALSKFEKGGIVGGNSSHGDRNLARVNSGEMILNKAQQGTLWNMLNGKGGIGGNVQFKIRGADLIGVINNENSRRRG